MLETYRIDDATDDVVGGILVLVVLVSVRVGHLRVGWLVGYLRLLRFPNHSNVFTAAKPFLLKTNLCISQNRFCSTDASLLKGLNSFTAPRSPPRIEPASTLPPLLPSFSFSRFRFGRPRRSPRLKRTEEQVGHWTMTKEEEKNPLTLTMDEGQGAGEENNTPHH